MAFCPKCGVEVKDGAKFCPVCGEAMTGKNELEEKVEATVGAASEKWEKLNDTRDATSDYSKDDAEKNKGMCVLAYLGILLLIPLLSVKNSKFTRFHCNQGLVLCIFAIIYSVIVTVITSILTAISWRLGVTISSIFSIVALVFLAWIIIGIVNVCNGKAKELPIIGGIKILK